MPGEDQPQQHQQQQQQQHDTKTAANSNGNPNSSICHEIANVTHALKEKKKLVRRAFSMPRNLFRLSQRVKISNSATATKISSQTNANSSETTTPTITTTESVASMSNSCNQTVQINSNEQNKLNLENEESNTHRTLPVSSEMAHTENKPDQDNKHRIFRRSTWKKFLFSRFILHSINLKVISFISFHQSFSIFNFARNHIRCNPQH